MADERRRRGRGEGSIEDLPSGKFRVVVSAGLDPGTGRRRKLTKTFDRKKDAVEWRAEQLKTVRAGAGADAGRLTVGEWMTRWLGLRKSSVEPTTHDQYESHVRLHITPHIGRVRLADVRPSHVAELYRKLGEAGMSAAMQRKVGTTLRSALKGAIKLQLLAVNPALAVDKPKALKASDVHVWDIGQVARFLTALRGDPAAALFVLAVETGMRRGEMLALHWDAVDLKTGAVSVRQALEERKGVFRLKDVKTKSSRRRLRLSPPAVESLLAHRERQMAAGTYRPDGKVFCDRAGDWMSKSQVRGRFMRAYRRACEAGGEPLPCIRFHDLRHTAATLMLLGGINVKAVASRLGHASAQMTLNVYSHFMPEMDEQAVTLMARIIGPAMPGRGPDAPSVPSGAPRGVGGDSPTAVPPAA